jgi:hypothetical protein
MLPDAAPETSADSAPEVGMLPDAAPESSTDGAPEASLDAQPCVLAKPYSTKNPTCNSCAEQKCCAQMNDCFVDPACDDTYVNCILACALFPDGGDAGMSLCMEDCGVQAPQGKLEYDAAIGCADANCVSECQ